MTNGFKRTVEKTGLNQDSLERLVSGFDKLFPGNGAINTAYAYVLESMDSNCLTEITHCVDVATDVAFLGQEILSDIQHSKEFGFGLNKQEQLDGVILAALFHDIALGYDRAKLQGVIGNKLLHRWDKNNGIPEDTDSYRGAVLLEREVGDKIGLSDKAVGMAINILKNHKQLEYPWQTLLEFGDSMACLNGDNDSRAVIESYLLGDHLDSYRERKIDKTVLDREIDFWKDVGIGEFGSKLGTKIKWNYKKAQKRMQKKEFFLLDYIKGHMPDIYHKIIRQAETRNRVGFIAPDVWAIRSYNASLKVLSDNKGLPQNLAEKLFEAYQETFKLHRFYGGE